MLVTDLGGELGYAAIEAGDGASGLKVLQSKAIDLLITDVGLPRGMNGRQMADAARSWRPNLKVLSITGNAESAVIGAGQLAAGMQVITKPFAMEIMASRIGTSFWEDEADRVSHHRDTSEPVKSRYRANSRRADNKLRQVRLSASPRSSGRDRDSGPPDATASVSRKNQAASSTGPHPKAVQRYVTPMSFSRLSMPARAAR
jgi:DNA-binding response OmpR family regulator